MIEGFCRPKIYDKCLSITGTKPLVSLKGKPIPHWDYDGFYAPGQTDRYLVYENGLVKKIIRSANHSPIRKAASLFSRKGDIICEGWVKERYGDWETALKEHKTFTAFINEFESYFRERKSLFMEKTNEIIEKMPKQLTKDGRIRTNSHGGVANLLKVLTKTMHEQGSSIKTIAKVQYAVCTQAGIYIPDEFITDVLVAADINPNVLVGE